MLSFFPRDVLDEMWDLFKSVSEGFPTYSTLFAFVPKTGIRFIIGNRYLDVVFD